MPFSDDTKQLALVRSGGRCECKRFAHRHSGRCSNRAPLEYHHRTAVGAGGDDSLSNCEVLCLPCHKLTQTYGRS